MRVNPRESLQKIANVIPTAAVNQSAKVHGPLVYDIKAEVNIKKKPTKCDFIANCGTNENWIDVACPTRQGIHLALSNRNCDPCANLAMVKRHIPEAI